MCQQPGCSCSSECNEVTRGLVTWSPSGSEVGFFAVSETMLMAFWKAAGQYKWATRVLPLPCHHHRPSCATPCSLRVWLVLISFMENIYGGLTQVESKCFYRSVQNFLTQHSRATGSSSFEPFIPGSEKIHRFMPLELVCYVNTSYKYYVFSLGVMMWKSWQTLASFTLYN